MTRALELLALAAICAAASGAMLLASGGETDLERLVRWDRDCERRGQVLGAVVEVAPGDWRPVCRPVWGER